MPRVERARAKNGYPIQHELFPSRTNVCPDLLNIHPHYLGKESSARELFAVSPDCRGRLRWASVCRWSKACSEKVPRSVFLLLSLLRKGHDFLSRFFLSFVIQSLLPVVVAHPCSSQSLFSSEFSIVATLATGRAMSGLIAVMVDGSPVASSLPLAGSCQ